MSDYALYCTVGTRSFMAEVGVRKMDRAGRFLYIRLFFVQPLDRVMRPGKVITHAGVKVSG